MFWSKTEGHLAAVGHLPLFTPSCRTPTVIHWMNGRQVWSSPRLLFNLFRQAYKNLEICFHIYEVCQPSSQCKGWKSWDVQSLLLCQTFSSIGGKVESIILVAILTNFERMNGTDVRRGRGTRPTEAVKPIMAPRGFLLPACLLLPTNHLLSLHPYTLLQPNLYCPFLQLLLQQPLSALPNSTAPRSTLRLLFLALPPAAGGNHPPQLPASKPPIFHPWDRSFAPDFLLWPLPGCFACSCHHFCSVGTGWISNSCLLSISIYLLLEMWGLDMFRNVGLDF